MEFNWHYETTVNLYALQTAVVAIASLVLTIVSNRLIGNKDILPWLVPRRFLIYGANGLMMSLLAYCTGAYSSTGIALAGIFSFLGYAIFRQPGPDIAFYAGHGRATVNAPDPEWILRILEKVHGIKPYVFHCQLKGLHFPTDLDRVEAGVIGGTYRGLWLFPLAIAMSFFYFPAFLLGFLGLGFGLTYWLTGAYGPIWKREEGFVARAELLMGGLMVWPTMALPIILGSL